TTTAGDGEGDEGAATTDGPGPPPDAWIVTGLGNDRMYQNTAPVTRRKATAAIPTSSRRLKPPSRSWIRSPITPPPPPRRTGRPPLCTRGGGGSGEGKGSDPTRGLPRQSVKLLTPANGIPLEDGTEGGDALVGDEVDQPGRPHDRPDAVPALQVPLDPI